MTLNILGVDPGPCTGIVTLHWAEARCLSCGYTGTGGVMVLDDDER